MAREQPDSADGKAEGGNVHSFGQKRPTGGRKWDPRPEGEQLEKSR